jgi:hypothetical protein
MAELEFTNKLLKEAIADAEAVRQTAIENAKLSLEETFTPQIKSMLERKLRAENAEEGTEEATETPFQEGEPEGSSEMPADSSDIGAGDNKEPSDDAFASADDDMSGEAPADSATDWYEDWSEGDFDLDEVIKELEEDVKLLEGGEEGEEEGQKEETHDSDEELPPAEGEEDEDEGEYPEGEPAGVEGEELPADSSHIGEPGATKFTLDEFISMMQEAGYDIGEMGFDHVAPAAEPPMEESELNLEEILAELEAEEAGEPDSEEMASEVQALQEQLAEYRGAVDILRGKLNEVNLLNAKLLYTNKIFRKEGLTNEQKITIVEQFDRATTVREVKMVYSVLAESLVPQKVAKAAKGTKKIVAEGLASKATPSTAPKTEAPEVIAENSVAKRLQQLAGIIS